jgi:glutathione synthetase
MCHLMLILQRIVSIDDFVRNLWEIHQELKHSYIQPVSLGLFRSDYMVHADQSTSHLDIKQVEFNTIASSFGGLSTQATKIHQYLYTNGFYGPSPSLNDFPSNNAAQGLASGILFAHKKYNELIPESHQLPRCILFVVQDGERNAFDQKHLENVISAAGVKVFRIVFQRILDETSLDEKQTLIYQQPQYPSLKYEVTTVYYRAGYAPTEYISDRDWKARFQVERSKAIKCPTVLTQLAGLKKVQQVLATPPTAQINTLSPFFKNNPDEEALVRKTFVPMYPLDGSPAGLEGRQLATNPQTARKFVLKPQREGGGNNIYRDDIPIFLEKTPQQQWEAYVLMEMIEPPPQRNTIHRNGQTKKGGVICELGIFGACVWENSADGSVKIHYNEEVGHLLRTKGDESYEGGVAAGFGALDSPLLVEDAAIFS